MPLRADSRPISSMHFLKRSRSSALRIASAVAPMSWQPYFSRTPDSARASPTFRPVCPPRVGRTASGRSLAMICSTTAGVIGSM